MGLNGVKGAAGALKPTAQSSSADFRPTAVRKIRESMWGGVTTRRHVPERCYSFNAEGTELMLHGTVSCSSSSCEFRSAEFRGPAGRLRPQERQVGERSWMGGKDGLCARGGTQDEQVSGGCGYFSPFSPTLTFSSPFTGLAREFEAGCPSPSPLADLFTYPVGRRTSHQRSQRAVNMMLIFTLPRTVGLQLESAPPRKPRIVRVTLQLDRSDRSPTWRFLSAGWGVCYLR